MLYECCNVVFCWKIFYGDDEEVVRIFVEFERVDLVIKGIV